MQQHGAAAHQRMGLQPLIEPQPHIKAAAAAIAAAGGAAAAPPELEHASNVGTGPGAGAAAAVSIKHEAADEPVAGPAGAVAASAAGGSSNAGRPAGQAADSSNGRHDSRSLLSLERLKRPLDYAQLLQQEDERLLVRVSSWQ